MRMTTTRLVRLFTNTTREIFYGCGCEEERE